MRTHMLNKKARRVAARISMLLACATVATPGAAHAQPDSAAILLHGLNSNAGTWNQFIADLQPIFTEPLVAVTLPQQVYQTQGAALPGLTTGFVAKALVGHSNGGIVAREAARQGFQTNAVVTIGSPNSGAPVADSITSGRVQTVALTLASTIACPLFDITCVSPAPPPDIADWLSGWVQLAWMHSELFMATLLDILNLVGWVPGDLLDQMGPGGYASTVLNAGTNQSAFMSAVSHRIGITTKLDNGDGALWQLLAQNNWESWSGGLAYAQGVYVVAHIALLDYSDPSSQLWSSSWLLGAQALGLIDYYWCTMIGLPGQFAGDFQNCSLSDALVPLTSQVLPTGNAAFSNDPVSGVSHNAQLKDLEVAFNAIQAFDQAEFERN